MRLDTVQAKLCEARILTGDIHAKNDFDDPEHVVPAAFDAVKDMNVCGIYGSLDTVAPFAISAPLWELLDARAMNAVQRRVEYPTVHGLDSHRVALTRFVADFLADSLKVKTVV